jgi:hypothetical protein
VRTQLRGWIAAAGAMLAALALVIADVTDGALRRWWDVHALTTDTVAGLLVLAITLEVADQVLRRRQVRDRSRAVAAQAAIIVGQAARSYRALSAELGGSGDGAAADAADAVQTYMMMLLVSAPLLIDDRVARNFLEQAQRLAGEMALALSPRAKRGGRAGGTADRMAAAVDSLRAAAGPLLRPLNTDQLIAAGADTAPAAGSVGTLPPDAAGSPRPDGAGSPRPDGAGSSRPDGAGSPRPDGAGSPPEPGGNPPAGG